MLKDVRSLFQVDIVGDFVRREDVRCNRSALELLLVEETKERLGTRLGVRL